MRRLLPTHLTPSSRRSGAALMEVLIAILAMGIGVVSLMSLFPLSVIRTAQAHQLTVGTGLRINAEEFLKANPRLWFDPNANGNRLEHENESFIFDPLGFTRGLTADFGGPASLINRYHGNYTTPAAAEGMMVYDGNWLTQADETGVTATATSVTFGANVNLSAVPSIPGPIPSRVVLFDGTGRLSATRTISSITNPATSPVVSWADNVSFTVVRARVETKEEQFTWALTVRREDTSLGNPANGEFVADIFIPIFFRRDFTEESETPLANGGNPVFNIGSTEATIIYTGARPAIRKGGYVFDSDNCFWYRVSDYSETGNTIRMDLEFPAQANSNGAVFFKGLVDVYFLGTKQVGKLTTTGP